MKRLKKYRRILGVLLSIILFMGGLPIGDLHLHEHEEGLVLEVHAEDAEECEYCSGKLYGDWICSGGTHCGEDSDRTDCYESHHCTDCGDCMDNTDALCEDCGYCIENCCECEDRCDNCGEKAENVCEGCNEKCSECAEDDLCADCGKICKDCCDETGYWCEDCGICFGCANAICDGCGKCDDCATVCEGCGGKCTECADWICGDCNLCPDCIGDDDYCSYCDICINCAGTICYCGEGCANCSMICEGCEEKCSTCASDEICSSCGEYCRDCMGDDDWCDNCNTCRNCADLICYCGSGCSECSIVCEGCEEQCENCTGMLCFECSYCIGCVGDYGWCENCNNCGDCVEVCYCGSGCADCATVCPECNEKCTECSYDEICGGCDVCKDCAGGDGNFCEGCGTCINCAEYICYCGNGCSECATVCPECNEKCTECSYDEICRGCNVCKDCAGGEENFCTNCGICIDCTEYICSCGNGCSECALICSECAERCENCAEELCTDCGKCLECSGADSFCQECMKCSDCTINPCACGMSCEECGIICEDCGEHCLECYEFFCYDCGICRECAGEDEWCVECDKCSDCADICSQCGLICQDCAESWCEDCESCYDCLDLYCESCGICESCATAMCQECGYCSDCAALLCVGCETYCESCAVICELCETCEHCVEICPDCGYCMECCETKDCEDGKHPDVNKDGFCDDCGETVKHTHSYGTGWRFDDEKHWKVCKCGVIADQSGHKDRDKDRECDTCGYVWPMFNQQVVRLSGATRYETGYKVADELKEQLGVEKFDAVVVATGKNFADALSGSYLAVVKNAPILLTNGKADNIAQLHDYIRANVKAQGTVYILGGDAAVPKEVEVITGYQIKRLYGSSRYETNLKILEEAGVKGKEFVVSTGKNFADSLSASAVKLPILLVKTELTEDQRTLLSAVKGTKFYIIGGTGAVTETIENQLGGYGRIERISGKSRYETSVAVAEKFFKNVDLAVLADAKGFPDGLCGGPLAASLNAPLILTADGKTEAAADYTIQRGIKDGYVLGGTARISDESARVVFKLKENVEIIKK